MVEASRGIRRFTFSLEAAKRINGDPDFDGIIETLKGFVRSDQGKMLNALGLQIVHLIDFTIDGNKVLAMIAAKEETGTEFNVLYLGKRRTISLFGIEHFPTVIPNETAGRAAIEAKRKITSSIFTISMDNIDERLFELEREARMLSPESREGIFMEAWEESKQLEWTYHEIPKTGPKRLLNAVLRMIAYATNDDLKDRAHLLLAKLRKEFGQK